MNKHASIIFVIVIFILSFLLLRPFMVPIMSAAALAYLFYPLYSKLVKKIKIRTLASLLTCTAIIILVLLPFAIIVPVVGFEIKSGYNNIIEWLNTNSAQTQISGFLPVNLPEIYEIKDIIRNLATQSLGLLQGVISGLPNLILNIFISIFCIYYFLKHGEGIRKIIKEILPLSEDKYKKIFSRFDDISRGMVLGQITIAIIQGVLAGIGFIIFGVPHAILWAFLTTIISIIPLLGAAIVWVPVAIYLLIIGHGNGNYIPAAALLIYGTFVISLIDNFLKPKIVGDRANIHPLLVLFGILGGIQLFGIAGILIGPMIFALFEITFEIYKEYL